MITINQSDGRGLTNIHGTEATNALSIPITFPRLMHPQVVMTNLRDNLRCEINRIPGFTKTKSIQWLRPHNQFWIPRMHLPSQYQPKLSNDKKKKIDVFDLL